MGTNRNITMDNWFSSILFPDSIAKGLYKLTMIDTILKDKLEISSLMVTTKGRPAGDSKGTTTLLLYLTKNRCVPHFHHAQ